MIRILQRFYPVVLGVLLLGTSTGLAYAQDASPDSAPENPLLGTVFDVSGPAGESCSDYYKFGSVQVIASPVNVPPAGFPLSFKGEIINENAYPIVDAQVYAKIFRTDRGGNTQRNGYDMLDFFLVKDDLSLPASTSVPLEFSWKMPQALVQGEYQIAFFVTSAHRYNLQGLSFTDDVTGNTTSFSVTRGGSREEQPYFIKDTVTLNNEPYFFANFPPRVAADTPATITTQLFNPSTETAAVTVTWKLYSWDGLRDEQLVDTKTETVVLNPGSMVPVTYVGNPHDHTVSYVLIDAAYKDAHSILNVRYAHDGKNEARINFPAVTQYPLAQGVEETLFSCVHAMEAQGTEGELSLTLTTPDGNEIVSKTFSGTISGAMMAHALTFVPQKTYTDFDLTATLKQNGNVVETVTQSYRCEALMPGQCSNTLFTIPRLVIAAVFLMMLGIIALFMLRRRHAAPIEMTTAAPIITTKQK